MSEVRRRPGRPRKLQWIEVKTVERHSGNPQNPFAGMDPEKRLEEFIRRCAKIWAETCQESARLKKAA